MEVGRTFWGDESKAEDVAQETLMRLWLVRDRLETEDVTEALLVRMAKNVCVNMWRQERARPTVSLEEGKTKATDEGHKTEHEDNMRMLQKAIDQLPPNEQRLFRMRHEMDMDISQIAATTSILPRSISAIISSARRKITEILKKEGVL